MNTEDITSALTGTVYNRIVELRDEIKQSIADHGLRASGRTQDSLRVAVEGNSVILYGRAFFPALQYGSSRWTGATGVRCTFERFREIIRQWVTDKGLNFGQAKEQERAIGAITAKIIKSGTRLKRQGGKIDVYDTLIDVALADIGQQVQLVMAQSVDVVIDKWKI